MKTSKLSLLVLSLFLISCLTSASTPPPWNTSPSALKITVYAVAASVNPDCSGAKVISSFTGGREFDFEQNPTLMSGILADGTYQCVIL
jgi:hypothetical protein